MATIDYMVAAYGPFAASATGGNALARDFLAGVAAMYAAPCMLSPHHPPLLLPQLTTPIVYEHVGTTYKLEWPTTILALLAAIFTIPIYIFYWKGPEIRKRSKFAQSLASDEKYAKGLRSVSAPVSAGGEKAKGEKAEAEAGTAEQVESI